MALVWKMICNLGDPMSLRHPVASFIMTRHKDMPHSLWLAWMSHVPYAIASFIMTWHNGTCLIHYDSTRLGMYRKRQFARFHSLFEHDKVANEKRVNLHKSLSRIKSTQQSTASLFRGWALKHPRVVHLFCGLFVRLVCKRLCRALLQKRFCGWAL